MLYIIITKLYESARGTHLKGQIKSESLAYKNIKKLDDFQISGARGHREWGRESDRFKGPREIIPSGGLGTANKE